jgi:hypothetical protein
MNCLFVYDIIGGIYEENMQSSRGTYVAGDRRGADGFSG